MKNNSPVKAQIFFGSLAAMSLHFLKKKDVLTSSNEQSGETEWPFAEL